MKTAPSGAVFISTSIQSLPRHRSRLNFLSHVQILLRDAARIVGRQRACDFRVPNIDVWMMLRGFCRFRYSPNEGNACRERLELKRLGKNVTLPAPTRKCTQSPLNRDVG